MDPEIFALGPLRPRYYGVLFLAAFYVGYYVARWMYRREGRGLEDLDRLLLYMMGGAVIGARLGHCFFYDPSYYLLNPVEIIKVWRGGLASHGGALGIALSLWLYSRPRPDQPYLWVFDHMAVPTALGGFFIRLGNFFNSEILGVPTTAPWAIVFSRYDSLPRHPAQLYESLAYMAIFWILVALYRWGQGRLADGYLIGSFFVLVFGVRFFIEFVKERQAAYGHDLPLTVGQWLSIPVVLAGAVLFLRALQLSRRSPPES
jgi:prolipoprotein diacylglyceryl transferase